MVAAVLSLASSDARPATLSPSQAAQHVGQNAAVKGIVAEIGHSRSGVMFLDFGAPYPDAEFTAVIFSDDVSRFPGIEQAEGKTVTVTGTIQLYHGRPEIILQSRSQLTF